MSVGADTGKVTGLLANTKLFLNGTRIDKQIVVIDNTSYLPLRALAETLGLGVEWNAQDNSILLTGNAAATDADTAVQNELLESLQKENKELKAKLEKYNPTLPVVGDFPNISVKDYLRFDVRYYVNEWNENQFFKVNGKFYDKGIGIPLHEGETRYVEIKNPDIKYAKFTEYFALDEMSKNAAADSFKVKIYAGYSSDTVIYEKTIKKSDGLVAFDIDIAGLSEPRMTFSCEGRDTLYPVIINPALK